jgi:Spy/CpxP family protein refolding chaperone
VNYWKVILATVVIFGAGVFTGGLLVNCIDHPHSKNPHRPPTPTDALPPENHDRAQQQRPPEIPMPRIAEKMGKQFVQQLNDTLQLTPEQREKIEKIIAAGQEQNREIWTNVAPKMRAVMQDVNQQIRAELTPDQLMQFEELLKHPPRRPQNSTNAPETKIDFKTRMDRITALTNFPSAWSNTDLTPEQQIQKLKEMEQQNHNEIFRRFSEERIQELEAQRMTNTVLIAPTNAPAN